MAAEAERTGLAAPEPARDPIRMADREMVKVSRRKELMRQTVFRPTLLRGRLSDATATRKAPPARIKTACVTPAEAQVSRGSRQRAATANSVLSPAAEMKTMARPSPAPA